MSATVLRANDKSGLEAVEIYKAQYSDIPWGSAISVDDRGLLLTSVDGTVAVQFDHLICGYKGTSPCCTAEVLALAGFGDEIDLRKRTTTDVMVTLRKTA